MWRFVWLQRPQARLVSYTWRHHVNACQSSTSVTTHTAKRCYTLDEDSLILKRPEEGTDISSIANEIGRSFQAAYRRCLSLKPDIRVRTVRHFTADEDALIVRRRGENVTFSGIARELDRAGPTIRRRWFRFLRRTADCAGSGADPIGPKGKLLNGLDVEQAATLILQRRREGRSFEAIAAELGCSSNTAAYRYSLVCPSNEISHTNSRRPYTETEKQTIQSLQLEGLPIGTIASKLGRTIGSIHYHVTTEKSEPTQRKTWKAFTADEDRRLLYLREQGATYSIIGVALGRSRRSVHARWQTISQTRSPSPKRPKRLWTGEEKDALLNLYRQKVTISGIASTLGRSWQSTRNRLQIELLFRGEPFQPTPGRPGRKPR